MPFTAETFKPLLGMATSSQPRMFAYRTNDLATGTAGNIEAAGYFNSLANDLNQGDHIFTHADASAVPATCLLYGVRSVMAGVVTIQRAGV